MFARFMMAIAIVSLCSVAVAQVPATGNALGYTDSFQINFIPNAAEAGGAPTVGTSFGGILAITNAGFHANPTFAVTNSDVCVNIYTFSASAVLQSCCSCRVPANNFVAVDGLLPPGTPASANIIVKLVTTLPSRVPPNSPPSTCDARVSPSSALGSPGGFATGIRAWGIGVSNSGTTLDESFRFKPEPLGELELAKLNQQCAFSANQCTCLAPVPPTSPGSGVSGPFRRQH